jgi:hypothetical protein
MKPNTIVQFECFDTSVPPDEFISKWQYYAEKSVGDNVEVTLLQSNAKNRFKYISQHEYAADNFDFHFMKGRLSENFYECNVKVIQAGGYSISQMQCMHDNNPDDVKIVVFIKNETELLLLQQSPPYRYLNVYQPYFQSCLFAGVLEFYVEKARAHEFVNWIRSVFRDAEGGVYNECVILHA